MLEEVYCPSYFRTYVSVNLDAIQSNIKAVKQKIGLEKKIVGPVQNISWVKATERCVLV